MLRTRIVHYLLTALNSRWLNNTPCQYKLVGNIEAFDYSFLESEVKSRPNITVQQILDDANTWKACPMSVNGLTVIEPDGSIHEATVWDHHELRRLYTQSAVRE